MKKTLKILKWLLWVTAFIFGVIILLHLFYPIPLKKTQEYSKTVYDKNGKLLYATTNQNGIWRFKTDLQKIDPLYIKMLLNYEDKHFQNHFGVDFLALFRATFQYIQNGYIVSGASTITMQLAKLLEPKKRTIANKLFEILRAFELELFYTKEEILSYYLTLTPYGGNVESITAGCWRYFGKPPVSLSPSEAAMLVALPQAPEANRADKNPKRAKRSRDKVLLRSFQSSIISKKLYTEAITQTLPQKLYPFPRYAPHLCQRVLKEKKSLYTTIDKDLQKSLQRWARLKGEIMPKDVTVASVIVDNKNYEIVAYLGSHYMFSKKTQGYIDMVQAMRSPGSTLKPFIYALAFQEHLIDPLTIIEDKESVFSDYKPKNFNKLYNGEVTIAYALQHSLNIPAVKVLQRVGVNRFVDLLNSVTDIKIPKNRASLSIALGGLGVNMMQLASLYTALANDGIAKKISYIKGQKSKKIKFLSKKASRKTNAILQEVTPPKGFIQEAVKIAFKTGTSYGYRDFWSVAYTKDYTVVLLVAKPNAKPMLRSSGLKSAAPLAFEIMGIINSLYGLNSWDYSSKEYLVKPPKLLRYFDKKENENLHKFTFAYPKEGTRYRSSNCKDVKVTALLKNGKPPYIWYMDGKQIKKNSAKISYSFDSGSHTITAIDSIARIVTQNIWVDKPDCKNSN